jgi:DNA-binding GntR family transcriptional regulator
MTREIKSRLKERLQDLEDARQSGDALQAVNADLEFRRTICQVSKNGRLLGLWEQLAEQTRLIRAAEAAIDDHFQVSYVALAELSDEDFTEALGKPDSAD